MRQRGNTLLEIVFATAVFAIMLIAVASLLPTVMRASRRAQNVLAATQLGQQIIETVRAQPFPLLTDAYTDLENNSYPAISAQLANTQAVPQLPGFPNVQVGNAVYNCLVTVTLLTPHVNASGQTDKTPREKQITVTVAWDAVIQPAPAPPPVTSVTLTTAAYDALNQ